MQFHPTAIDGAFIIELEPLSDTRGFFARAFCRREFEQMGMNSDVVQANISFNRHQGTLRGLHYQVAPAPETKLVRCTRGAILDIIVDLRHDSPSRGKHVAVELSDENHRALFVPTECAHGFQTLQDDSEVIYLVSGYYTPECERGLRYSDPTLNLPWPLPVAQISDKDANWPLM